MTTTGPDHHLAAARATAVAVEPPTTARLLDEISSHLNELEQTLGTLNERLSPVLTDETPAPLTGQTRPEPRTDLARRLLELATWAERLHRGTQYTLERIEL